MAPPSWTAQVPLAETLTQARFLLTERARVFLIGDFQIPLGRPGRAPDRTQLPPGSTSSDPGSDNGQKEGEIPAGDEPGEPVLAAEGTALGAAVEERLYPLARRRDGEKGDLKSLLAAQEEEVTTFLQDSGPGGLARGCERFPGRHAENTPLPAQEPGRQARPSPGKRGRPPVPDRALPPGPDGLGSWGPHGHGIPMAIPRPRVSAQVVGDVEVEAQPSPVPLGQIVELEIRIRTQAGWALEAPDSIPGLRDFRQVGPRPGDPIDARIPTRWSWQITYPLVPLRAGYRPLPALTLVLRESEGGSGRGRRLEPNHPGAP